MAAAQSLAQKVGVAPACEALSLPRATFYRHRRGSPPVVPVRPTPHRALTPPEREQVLAELNSRPLPRCRARRHLCPVAR